MTTVDFITALFYEIDEQLRAIPKHPEAHLWPSEVVTLGLLHALKGVGNRPFYRWLTRDYRPSLLLDSRVLRDQQLNERKKQRFASRADIVHELEEPQVDREFLLGNAPMRTQPTA